MKITKSFLKQVIKEEIEKLEEAVGEEQITIKISPYGADVSVDGENVDKLKEDPKLPALKDALIKAAYDLVKSPAIRTQKKIAQAGLNLPQGT